MVIELSQFVSIKTSLQNYVLNLKPILDPYLIVENKQYIRNINLGLSIRDVLKEFDLGDLEYVYHTDKPTDVILKTPLGLWEYIKDLDIFRDVEVKHIIKNKVPTGVLQDLSNLDLLKDPEYAYQKTAIMGVLQHRYGILKARPGSGKTIMGLLAGKYKGDSILWINDRIDLARQARNTAIEQLGFNEKDCGLLQGDNEDIQKYTFTTIQKINKVLNEGFNDISKSLRHFDTIIIDECHHTIGSYNSYKTYFQVINEVSHNNLYGLTATVKRVDDNQHLVHAILGPIIYEVTEGTRTMEAKVTNKHFRILTSDEKHKTFLNTYTGKTIPARVDEYLLFHPDYLEWAKPQILEMISRFSKIMIVSPRVAGAQELSKILDGEGIVNFLVYGAIRKRERLYTDKVIVTTLDLVKEGFDIPDLEAAVILARPIHKQIRTQVVGRTERYVEGKNNPEVLFLIPHIKRENTVKTTWEEVPLDALR